MAGKSAEKEKEMERYAQVAEKRKMGEYQGGKRQADFTPTLVAGFPPNIHIVFSCLAGKMVR